MPVLVSARTVAAFVGVTVLVEGICVWLGETWTVGSAAEVFKAGGEAVEEGEVDGRVASVVDPVV